MDTKLTLDEVRADMRSIKNKIRCVISDRDRDIKRVYLEHRRTIDPMVAELHRLRFRVTEAARLLIEYEEVVTDRRQELLKCLEAPRIKKLLKLIRRVNGMKPSRHDDVGHHEAQLTNEKASTLRFVIAGYENEIGALRRLLANDCRAFRKREEELKKGIQAQCGYFEMFLQHKARGDEILDQAYARLDELRALERNMGGDKKVQKLSDKAQQLMELMLSMSPEMIKAALKMQENN